MDAKGEVGRGLDKFNQDAGEKSCSVLSEVLEDGDWLEDEPANGTSGKPMTPVPRAVTPPTEGSVDASPSYTNSDHPPNSLHTTSSRSLAG